MDDKILKVIKSDNADDLSLFFTNGMDINTRLPQTHFNNVKMFKECPPLHCVAAFFGSIRCLKYLFMNGSDLLLKDKKNRSIIHFAAAGGSLEIVNFLSGIVVDLDWSIQDSYGDTVIHYAIFYNHPDLVYWFWYQYNMNLSVPNKRKMTPLHLAVVSENVDLIEFLCKNGSNVNAKNVHSYYMTFCFTKQRHSL